MRHGAYRAGLASKVLVYWAAAAGLFGASGAVALGAEGGSAGDAGSLGAFRIGGPATDRTSPPSAVPSPQTAGVDVGADSSPYPVYDWVHTPLMLMADEAESVYAPPEPPKPEEGVNEGGVHLSLSVDYANDYFYRGLAHNLIGRGREDGRNLQFEGTLKFDLGRLPHPFIGVFSNVYNRDPVSKFEEVRPYGGFEWNIRPLTITAGHNSYIFPERDNLNTNEVFLQLTLDDSALFHAHKPVFSPYIYAAYDYDHFHGTYLEAGLKHDFYFEDWGLTVTPKGDVAYALSDKEFALLPGGPTTGFQHFDAGLVVSYSLDTLLNIPRRFGEFKLRGVAFDTGGIDHKLRADTQFWGGAGITFEY
jgi:hypothetical protein